MKARSAVCVYIYVCMCASGIDAINHITWRITLFLSLFLYLSSFLFVWLVFLLFVLALTLIDLFRHNHACVLVDLDHVLNEKKNCHRTEKSSE